MKNQKILIAMTIACMLIGSCKKEDTPTGNPSNAITFNPNLTYGSMTDIDGNGYKTIKIGRQIWMAENLKVTKYRNGNVIPNVTDGTAWSIDTTGAYCNYNNDNSNVATYGRLYNWYAVNDSGNIAPTGWHVATDDEWITLENFLGNSGVGGKMKEIGTTHWESPNRGADNSSGFTALPGGYRSYNGIFYLIGSYGNWWSSSAFSSNYAGFLQMYAWSRNLGYNYDNAYRYYDSISYGFPVRCVKDFTNSLTATVNGIPFTANQNLSAIYALDGTLVISGDMKEDTLKKIIITVVSAKTTGVYFLGGNKPTTGSANYTEGEDNAAIKYGTDSTHSGTITIIEINKTKQIIYGTFSFSAIKYSGTDTVSVANGEFILNYTQ